MLSAPVFAETVVELASQEIGTASSTTDEDWGGRPALTATVVVTDVGTSGTLIVKIEHSDTGTGSWTVVDTFTTITAATTGVTRTCFPTKPYVRVTGVVAVDAVEWSCKLAANPALMIIG